MTAAAQRPRHAPLPTLLLTAIMSALFLFAVVAVSVPAETLAATTSKAALCSANLRTKATTNAASRATIKAGTKVSVVAKVVGGKWQTTCAGEKVSGNRWLRIKSINGKSVKSLYGVTYLYGAKGLFRKSAPAPMTKYAVCSTKVRSSAAQTATREGTLDVGAKVLVTATVSGSAWSTSCAGTSTSGTAWYRISEIDGASVQSLYGVAYVYGPKGRFKTSAPAPAPDVEPEAVPSPTPTPVPTPTPDPTPTPVPTPTPTPSPFANMSEGLDVSHWQGTINWTKVAAAGKRFVYMKASEDIDYVDPTYAFNRQGAKAAGLKVGAYHFAKPSTEVGDAIAEADHFVDTATPIKGELLPVLDLERTGGLGTKALKAWVKAYVARVYERLGVRAVIYVSPSFWQKYMGDTVWFAENGYDMLWVAHWTTAYAPIVPALNWSNRSWTFWQYTSSGTVPGISGRVDLNRYNGTGFKRVLIP